MSEPIQRWRGILLLIAGALAAAALVANLARTGRVAWAGVIVLLLVIVVVWRGTRRAVG